MSSAASSGTALDQQMHLLKRLETAAVMTLEMLTGLSALWEEVTHAVQAQHKFFSHALVMHLFMYPATRVQLLARDLAVTRLTATRFLDALTGTGILQRERFGRDNIYAHMALQSLLQPRKTVQN